jgi:hypothetical protein
MNEITLQTSQLTNSTCLPPKVVTLVQCGTPARVSTSESLAPPQAAAKHKTTKISQHRSLQVSFVNTNRRREEAEAFWQHTMQDLNHEIA